MIFANALKFPLNSTFMPTAADIVWETYPQCPINNTLIVRDALTALTNVSHIYTLSVICVSFNLNFYP